MTFPEVDYRGIFNSGSILYLILLSDYPKFTIVGASDAYLENTGRTREDIVGKGVFEAFPPNPTDAGATEQAFRMAFDRVIKTKKLDVMPIQKYDIPKSESEGGGFKERYWSVTHTPVLDRNGNVIQLAQRVEDVTEFLRLKKITGQMEVEVLLRAQEVKDTNNQLVQANEKLKVLDQLKTDFFANISHEFRTPLTLILGPLEDALHHPSKTVSGDALESMHRNTLRLLGFINGLLDLTRLEADYMTSVFEATDLPAFTTSLVGSFQSVLASANLKLHIDCPPMAKPVYIDRSQWEKIVLNLVSNAFKFTFEGSISVRLREDDGSIQLVVSDTGTGIPDGELSKVFDRFHRVKGARGRSIEGTGIGLALVQQLVKLQGGFVQVDSTVGKGTNFTVVVPIRTEPPEKSLTSAEGSAPNTQALTDGQSLYLSEMIPAAASSKAPLEQKSDETQQEKKRIALADDNSDMRAYITQILSPLYSVETYKDGEEAYEGIIQNMPDLLLSDVMMPNLDGMGLLKKLRTNPKTEFLPVVFLSARTGEEAMIEGLETGADDYLMKPFSRRELVARIKSNLDLSRLRNLQTVNRNLTEVQAELKQFVHVAAHDLIEPVRRISIMIELFLQMNASNLSNEQIQKITTIRRQALDLDSLIKDFRHLTKIDSGEISYEEIDAKLLIKDVLAEFSDEIEKKHVNVEVHGDLRSYRANRILIIQLYRNLISNALKHGEENMSLDFFQSESGGVLTLEVRNTGETIDKDNIPKLFVPFKRFSKSEGSGIGLYICKRIAELHGGQISCESGNQLTSFKVTLREKS